MKSSTFGLGLSNSNTSHCVTKDELILGSFGEIHYEEGIVLFSIHAPLYHDN